MRSIRLPTILTALALSSIGFAAEAGSVLTAIGADASKVSVSGLSSGAFMAVQYSVAYSASVMGVGVVAGGPYNCAFVNFGGIKQCMEGTPVAFTSFQAAQGFAAFGQIDPVSNIAKQKVYLFSGTQDTTVKQTVMDATLAFYKLADVPSSNIQYVNHYKAGHAFISPAAGNECNVTADPYVDTCPTLATTAVNYDQAGAILSQIYGEVAPKAVNIATGPVPFDQTEFISLLGAAGSSMADTGYVYIPTACSGTIHCAIHVVFHGCKQNAATVNDAVFRKVGYNNWAETNGIIVLYPQTATTILNPNACWDWWGYSGLNFQVQSSVQMSAVNAMVSRLTMTK